MWATRCVPLSHAGLYCSTVNLTQFVHRKVLFYHSNCKNPGEDGSTRVAVYRSIDFGGRYLSRHSRFRRGTSYAALRSYVNFSNIHFLS